MDAFHIRSTYSACVRSLSAFPNTTSSSVATAAAVKPIRERPDLLTPANASDSSLLLRHKKSPHIQKEPYSAPPDNLEGHKTADYVDHRMWTIRSSPQQSIWIGTKHSLVTKTTGTDGFLVAPVPSLLSLFPALPLYLSLAPAQASQPFYRGLTTQKS